MFGEEGKKSTAWHCCFLSKPKPKWLNWQFINREIMLSSFVLMSRILCCELWRNTLSASFAFSHLARTMAANECSMFVAHTPAHWLRQWGRAPHWFTRITTVFFHYAPARTPEPGGRRFSLLQVSRGPGPELFNFTENLPPSQPVRPLRGLPFFNENCCETNKGTPTLDVILK